MKDNEKIQISGKQTKVGKSLTIYAKDNIFNTLIPSPMNLHSHCFQRAMSGLSERSETKKMISGHGVILCTNF